ncbi:MAG: BREX system Lon protease-like protein BrxL [Prochlorothrix sp.]|nr:BREX system Lon protease-like protein BrxL [Prochlorothrix sp.]
MLPYPTPLVRQVFPGLCIDKTRLPASGLKEAGVPSFVAEWLLDKMVPGEGPLQPEAFAQVTRFVDQAFPRKDDSNVIRYDLIQGNVRKLIALLKVYIPPEDGKGQIPEPIAQIPVLNFNKCRISRDLIDANKMLLRQGVWGKISLGMQSDGMPEILDFEPFQCSSVDLGLYNHCRSRFTTDQWRDLLICSMGYNPENPAYTVTAKTWMLARLLPLVERNFSIMELAPKGTGKSYVFENISSKVALISGGKVTPAQLLFNGKTKEVGLLGRHDVVVLDEVQSLSFDNPDEVIGPLKNYLASGRYNRAGFAPIASDCSLVMLANIELDRELKPRYAQHLLANLPEFLSETAFLDRFSGIIPGWKIPKFNRDRIASQVGLKMDFFGEALLSLRRDSRFLAYAQAHTEFHTATIRDQNAILSSATGFLKILYPHLQLTVADFDRDCLQPACQLRQYIHNSLYYLDEEFRQHGPTIHAEATAS